MAPEKLAKLRRDLFRAEAHHRENPSDEMAAIWHGRRFGYLGAYDAAVDVYTKALEIHPESYKLLRHRGHRYISLRRWNDAIADLTRASELTQGIPDQVEPDGAPNPSGIPRSTTRSNIEYHLGLALYLAGRFDEALVAWQRCLELSRVNDDMLVAATYWNVLTLWRLGKDQRASGLLVAIGPEMEILENHAYHDLLLTFKGTKPEADLLDQLGPDGVASATLGFGMGAWKLAQGKDAEARSFFARVKSGPTLAAFGYIAAEAELAR